VTTRERQPDGADVERLRRRLAVAAPEFAPVPLAAVAAGVRRRRRLTVAAAAVGVAVSLGAAGTVARLATTGGPTRADRAAAPPSTAATRPTPPWIGPVPRCPQPAGGQDSGAQVDYVDFVRLGGREYLASQGTVPATALGGRAGKVACGLSTIGPGPAYRPRDGDAAYLAAGTSLYAVAGYPVTFRLAAPGPRGRFRLYEVDTAPAARHGADLLPLDGRVTAVEIRDGDATPRTLGRLTDPTRLRRLVAGVLAAPVDQRLLTSGPVLFVRFSLTDGTTVERAWSRTDRLLARGIRLPAAVNAQLTDLLT
jgi:hypothetical protein